jgi:hypothetical protein
VSHAHLTILHETVRLDTLAGEAFVALVIPLRLRKAGFDLTRRVAVFHDAQGWHYSQDCDNPLGCPIAKATLPYRQEKNQ